MNKRTHIVIHESILLYFITKIASRLEEAEAQCFIKKMLPLPAPQKVKCFRVRFRFQHLSSKCFRFHKNLTASIASASSFPFCFHIPVLYCSHLASSMINWKPKQG